MKTEGVEAASLDLTVGDRMFDSAGSVPREIPTTGIVLRAGQAVVVYTRETLSLPLNVFGLLSGKGRLIFYGVFVSPGKIDPGFQDRLRIGLFNGSSKPLKLLPGTAICSCSFFQMDSTVEHAVHHHLTEPVRPQRPGVRELAVSFWKDHWKWILGTLVTVVGVSSAVARALK